MSPNRKNALYFFSQFLLTHYMARAGLVETHFNSHIVRGDDPLREKP